VKVNTEVLDSIEEMPEESTVLLTASNTNTVTQKIKLQYKS